MICTTCLLSCHYFVLINFSYFALSAPVFDMSSFSIYLLFFFRCYGGSLQSVEIDKCFMKDWAIVTVQQCHSDT